LQKSQFNSDNISSYGLKWRIATVNQGIGAMGRGNFLDNGCQWRIFMVGLSFGHGYILF
jgi:hypothetical protein